MREYHNKFAEPATVELVHHAWVTEYIMVVSISVRLVQN